MRRPTAAAWLAVALAARAACATGLPKPYAPVNSTLVDPKFDPLVGALAKSKLLLDAAVTFDKTLNPPSGIICYVDPASGVVIGIDDGTGPRCGTAGAHEVIIPLLGKQFVSRVDVGVVPKTDLIGRLTFHVALYNDTNKLAPATKAYSCGKAPSVVTIPNLGATAGVPAVLTALVKDAREGGGLKGNFTAAQGAHLGAIRVGKCLTNRTAPANVTVVANSTSLKTELAQKAATALAMKNPRLPVPLALDAASLELAFTENTCHGTIWCNPSYPVTIEDTGCVSSEPGSRFVFVLPNRTTTDVLICPDDGVLEPVAIQELLQDEPDSCVAAGTCAIPPSERIIVDGGGGDCVGDCEVAGVECDATVPGQEVCDAACVNVLTDVNNCGTCGNRCNAGATCVNGGCQCTISGQTIPIGGSVTPVANYVPLSGTAPLGGIGCHWMNLAARWNNLGSPTRVNGGTPPNYCTLIYNSGAIPDRYLLNGGSPCGPVIADTSFTGRYTSSCPAAAPCCPAASGGGCLGVVNNANNPESACPPPNPPVNTPGVVQTSQNGYLVGPGKLTFPVGNGVNQMPPDQDMWLLATGVCANTGNAWAMVCGATVDSDGHVPGTGQPAFYNANYQPSGGTLAYVFNGDGCRVVGNQVLPNGTPGSAQYQSNINCLQCRLN